MQPTVLLAIYCVAIAAFSLAGGLLPGLLRMTHTRMQLAMSAVAGLMLGVAFYHLLPHSAVLFGGPAAIDRSIWWLMLGLIAMLLLLRLFHFHQHDFSHEEGRHAHPDPLAHGSLAAADVHAHAHDHTHAHAHAADAEAHAHAPAHAHASAHHHAHGGAHGLSWLGIGLGLGLHTTIDGVALGAALRSAHAGEGLAGIGVFLAILLHKPLDTLSVVTVMRAGGWSTFAQRVVNLLFALLCPLAAVLFYFGVDVFGDGHPDVVAAVLAFAAGTFICIALSDLLPEVHFHSHDRGKLTLCFLAGIALAYAMVSFEPASYHPPLH